MRRFGAEELRRFVEAIDRHLRVPVPIVFIGGAAAVLCHGARSPTTDLDTYAGDLEALQPALTAAREETNLYVPVNRAGVAELPLHHEDRLIDALPQLKRLRLFAPERHDLALSKLLRATEPDLAVLAELHAIEPFDLDLLVDRYLTEMQFAIGHDFDKDLHIVVAIERLSNTDTARRVDERLKGRRARGR